MHSNGNIIFYNKINLYEEDRFTNSISQVIIENNGLDATVTWSMTSRYNTIEYAADSIWLGAYGSSMGISIYLPYITQKPKIEAKISDSIEGWNRSTIAKVNVTEVYSNSADISLICNGEELLTKKYVVENDSITDEIELSGLEIEAGSKLEWGVTINDETSSTFEMDMTNIDITGPILNTELETASGWTKTRNLNINYHDEGVGNDRVYLANTDYIYGINEGDNSEDVLFELTGDVYTEKELNVFAVDSLGNYTIKTITVNKLDNTAPTITNANMQGSKLIITSNDEKEGLGEGSGVIKYRYLTSKQRLENPELTAENSIVVNKDDEIRLSNLNEVKFVYIVAEDSAGNVSEVYELILQELVLTSKINLNLADGKGGVELDWSDYDSTGIYFVIYRKEEGQENFEKIVSLEDKFSNNRYTDILGNDKAKPEAPTVNIGTSQSDIHINLASEDNGTKYTYYVEAYDSSTNALLISSNSESVKI